MRKRTHKRIIILTFIIIFMCLGVVIMNLQNKGKKTTEKEGKDTVDTLLYIDNSEDTKLQVKCEEKESENKTEIKVKDQSALAEGTPDIKVLLSDSGGNYYQKAVEISCAKAFVVKYGDKVKQCKGEDVITLTPGDGYTGKGNVEIVPVDNKSKITISSIKKGGGAPSYRGSIIIKASSKGLLVVNQLPLEEYLYGVVSSEVPESFNPEALKAQAVCARGFACKKMASEDYKEYGADLDDTTACQVYNNQPETKNSIKAVKDTCGIVPKYNNEIITPYYFSTSCGTTSCSEDVWGGENIPYLQTTLETVTGGKADLSKEKTFKTFIDDTKTANLVEQDMPMYRWTVFFSYEEISSAVNGKLAELSGNNLNAIFELQKNGKFVKAKAAIKSIGDIKKIEVTKRGKSGILLEIQLSGSEKTIKVSGQHLIRSILCPLGITITKQDGPEVDTWQTMPSAFFYVTENKKMGGFMIKGGGFGHGSGMSQNGANMLASAGLDYLHILVHYYEGIYMEKIY